MKLTKNDHLAIQWFCGTNSLKPALSIPPFQMHFVDRKTGLDKTCHLDFITIQFKAFKSEESKRKRREKSGEAHRLPKTPINT